MVVHNRFESTEGWIRMSCAFVVKGPGGEKPMIQRSLAEGLDIHGGEGYATVLEGEITVRTLSPTPEERTYKAGESFVEHPGEMHDRGDELRELRRLTQALGERHLRAQRGLHLGRCTRGERVHVVPG